MAPTAKSRLLLFIVVLLGVSLGILVPLTAAIGNGSPSQLVTGTLTQVDLTGLTGVVTTDLGIPIFFKVPKPYLLEDLSLGMRVTVEIDQEGRGNKIIEATRAEFLSPSTEESYFPSAQPGGGPLVGVVR